MAALVKTCAELSLAIYTETIPDSILEVGVAYEEKFDKDTDTLCGAYITDNTIYFAIEGSTTKRDWLNNFKIIKTDFYGIRAHRGFAMCASSLIDWAKSIIKRFPGKNIVMTGHSQGGAVAVLLAVALRPLGVAVITFGQPRVATKRELNLALYGSYIRVVNGSDAVPRKPWLGYSHSGTCIYISNDGEKIIDPSWLDKLNDRLLTFGERVRDHFMTDYIKELEQCA